ncbi:MAG: MBL fold metallo-hydrolase [Phycisphaerales bacterium]|nr:MAG: MBL fold metallo-hydrolase [Phycisphaerales bacterium]
MTPKIHTVDVNYLGTPEAIASYVIEGPEGPVMIETGPGSSTEGLTAGLAEIGLKPSDVKHTLVTHIHFDHAGASGWMARQGAHVYVHENGYPHLIDPSRLLESAKRIYKDKMGYMWGELLPIPAEQLTAVRDGDVLNLGGLKITALGTPGHAGHHHCYKLQTDQGPVCFTGDCAGTYIAESSFISVPLPPPELDLGLWMQSIERLEAEKFVALYPTHFGRVDDPAEYFARLKQRLSEDAEYVRDLMDEGLETEDIRRRYTEWLVGMAEEAKVPESKMGFYITDAMANMNVTGIMRYWTKLAEKAPPHVTRVPGSLT